MEVLAALLGLTAILPASIDSAVPAAMADLAPRAHSFRTDRSPVPEAPPPRG
jgi:hypothetical protein